MLVQLRSVLGAVLQGPDGLPLFWPAVWEMFNAGRFRPSTLRRWLGDIEKFYSHANPSSRLSLVDEVLFKGDLRALKSLLEGFLLSLQRADPNMGVSVSRTWTRVVAFVDWTLQQVAQDRFADLEYKDFHRLLNETLFALRQLAPARPGGIARNRATPQEVLDDLWDLVTPGSARNITSVPELQWRNFVILGFLYLVGLRPGELLSLPRDAIKSQRSAVGLRKYWVNVRYNPYEDDPRASPASLKNEYAQRQVPVSNSLSSAATKYLDGFGGRSASTTYLIANRYGSPLSDRGLRLLLTEISNALTVESKKLLADKNLKSGLSPHDGRHTCATARMQHYISTGVPQPEALEKMRAFFGWAKDSLMPQHYARLAYEAHLNSTLDDAFEARVAALRLIGA